MATNVPTVSCWPIMASAPTVVTQINTAMVKLALILEKLSIFVLCTIEASMFFACTSSHMGPITVSSDNALMVLLALIISEISEARVCAVFFSA